VLLSEKDQHPNRVSKKEKPRTDIGIIVLQKTNLSSHKWGKKHKTPDKSAKSTTMQDEKKLLHCICTKS